MLHVLEEDPILIGGKSFIITIWSASVDMAREHVLSVPIRMHFSKIPSVLQPIVGLDWLASLVGKVKCFDNNTVARKRSVYAKALIVITADKLLPLKLKVRIEEGHEVEAEVQYSWKSDICTSCRSFGHAVTVCRCGAVGFIRQTQRGFLYLDLLRRNEFLSLGSLPLWLRN